MSEGENPTLFDEYGMPQSHFDAVLAILNESRVLAEELNDMCISRVPLGEPGAFLLRIELPWGVRFDFDEGGRLQRVYYRIRGGES